MKRSRFALLIGIWVSLLVVAASAPANAINRARFCVDLTNRYTDTMPGQDALTGSTLPAHKHWAVVERQGVTVGTPGYMSGSCTPFFTINPGQYTLFLTSAVRVATDKFIWAFHDESEEWTWFSATFTVNSNPTGDTTLPVTFPGADGLAASLVGSVVNAAEMPAGTFKVYLEDCASVPGSSCAIGANIYLNPNHTDRKSIIAHEMGHAVASGFSAVFAYNYNRVHTNPLCRCDHVTTTNQLHCLQSFEQGGAGRNEGYAHFWAANIFNTGSHSTAPFGYYKEVLVPPGNIPQDVEPPPYPVDALTAFRWSEQRCGVTAETQVEMDWMTFLYFLHNKTAQAYSFPELMTVLQITDQFDDTWGHLVDAAEAVFGPGHPKVNHLIQAGNTYGVDH